MTSRKRRNRSCSPLRDPPQHHVGHRGYRQRDHFVNDRHNNGRNDRDNGQRPFNDANGEHGIPGSFYDDSPMGSQQSPGPSNDRSRGHDQRGRGRNRPQSSNSRRNPMPPPAPRPLRANEDKIKAKLKGAPKNDRPKTMPQANRDKCGACSQNHDIRYCPYPNTEDGRTKICPICNTANHAWFECWYYKREVIEQWTVCWINRRCLPALVHDAPLDEIFHSRVSLARETINDDGKSPIENFNSLPGPLSPAFVKKLMPLDVEDAHIQHELQEGRVVPWELKKENLEHIVGRTEIAIRDKSTVDMRIDRFIDGTRSSSESVPTANKQEFFHDRGHKPSAPARSSNAGIACGNTRRPSSAVSANEAVCAVMIQDMSGINATASAGSA